MLENAISRDRKVQVTFQTFFFCLCMSSTLHKYRNVCHKVSISSFLRLETRRSTKKQIWANWKMQFHVIARFNWPFKHFFFASVCHPRCTSIWMCATKSASRHFYVWKRVDRRKSRFERIGECNFTWSQSSSDLSNIFFSPLYVIHAAQVYECVPQSQHLGISTFGNASIDEKADLSELENAISRDRKVQVTFQTFFFCLCMPSTLHKYINVCHKVSISSFVRLETFTVVRFQESRNVTEFQLRNMAKEAER
jgi:hypothetical protein